MEKRPYLAFPGLQFAGLCRHILGKLNAVAVFLLLHPLMACCFHSLSVPLLVVLKM